MTDNVRNDIIQCITLKGREREEKRGEPGDINGIVFLIRIVTIFNVLECFLPFETIRERTV